MKILISTKYNLDFFENIFIDKGISKILISTRITKSIDIDMVILENINIDSDMDFPENINIDIDIDMKFLKTIDMYINIAKEFRILQKY